jgi:ketosteroid isomerase-like protein
MHSTTADQREQIAHCLEQWRAAELHGDSAALAGMLADDFVGVGPRGFMLPKAAWLARYAAGDLVNQAFALDDVQVRMSGAAAVAVGRLTQDTTYQGRSAAGQFRATLVWVRQERWMLAGLHVSPMAGPA